MQLQSQRAGRHQHLVRWGLVNAGIAWLALRKPIAGIAPCRARAASDHVAAVPKFDELASLDGSPFNRPLHPTASLN